MAVVDVFCFCFFNPATGLSFSVMSKGFDTVDKIIYFPQYKGGSIIIVMKRQNID